MGCYTSVQSRVGLRASLTLKYRRIWATVKFVNLVSRVSGRQMTVQALGRQIGGRWHNFNRGIGLVYTSSLYSLPLDRITCQCVASGEGLSRLDQTLPVRQCADHPFHHSSTCWADKLMDSKRFLRIVTSPRMSRHLSNVAIIERALFPDDSEWSLTTLRSFKHCSWCLLRTRGWPSGAYVFAFVVASNRELSATTSPRASAWWSPVRHPRWALN